MVQAVGNSRKEEREVELRAFGASSTRAAGFSHAPSQVEAAEAQSPKASTSKSVRRRMVPKAPKCHLLALSDLTFLSLIWHIFTMKAFPSWLSS